MTALNIRDLSGDHPFGARISGVTMANVGDEDVGQTLRDVFDDRGMIVFEDMENTEEMQFALSDVFGPPQVYAIKNSGVEDEQRPGVIHFTAGEGASTITEFAGRRRAGHVPWHFDACYAEKLNRGGILRMIANAPEEGMTGFADGVQMFQALSPEWQEKAENLSVIYHQYNMMDKQRFGLPEGWKLIKLQEEAKVMIEQSRDIPRTVHPAVWQRKTGEKVLHVSPWQADGIAGQEDAEGDALLEALCQEFQSVMQPYWHDWKLIDMLIWDNWRFLHSAGGYPPQYARDARRTTITGDYGLGCYKTDWQKPAEISA
jgi:taurine dioxygenase